MLEELTDYIYTVAMRASSEVYDVFKPRFVLTLRFMVAGQ